MVSLWPWKGDNTSPASFEKTLSSLSEKIAKQSSKLDSLRQRSRRFKALWTLYSTFAYLLYSIILALVVGWRSWDVGEYTAVAGGPVIIYVVRLGLTTYYNYRASTVQSNLNGLQKQRDTAVQKLKAATKYDITQDLLKKYGGTPTPKANSTANASQISNPNPNPATPKESRTSIVPPPTANIPGRNLPASLQNTPEHSTAAAQRLLKQNASFSPTFKAVPRQLSSGFQDGSADFAPNAFSTAPQYVQPGQGSRWYDRIMDVLLGEDEMLPRNRLALICSHCRLVNGQAPPGIKHLGDVGKWRCSGCGTMNGEEIEADKIFANIKEQTISKTGEPKEGTKSNRALRDNGAGNDDAQADHGEETDITQYSEDLDDGSSTSEREKEKVPEPSAEPKPPRRRVGRPRGSGKKQS